jgi:hypothetical protein
MTSPASSGFRRLSQRCRGKSVLTVCVVSLAWAAAASAQQRAIDTGKSVMTVRVYKAGLFSALGHDHEIAAPIAGGTVDTSAGQVELHANAAALHVRDPKVSDKDGAEIQTTMRWAPKCWPPDASRKSSFDPRARSQRAPVPGGFKVT